MFTLNTLSNVLALVIIEGSQAADTRSEAAIVMTRLLINHSLICLIGAGNDQPSPGKKSGGSY